MGYETLWHGSDLPRERLAPGRDGGIHLGSLEQAGARHVSAFLHEVVFDPGRSRRSKDAGGFWSGKVSSALASRMTSIVYLNRYEGVSVEDLDAANRYADAPDSVFRRHVRSAEDSWIALHPQDVRVNRIIPGKGSVTLYHGTTPENARDLLERGFSPDTWRSGGNGGGRGTLYLTTVAEDAAWFSNEMGHDTVLKVRVPALDLIVDPEDGTGEDAVREMLTAARHGLPAKLATRSVISRERFSEHLAPRLKIEPSGPSP